MGGESMDDFEFKKLLGDISKTTGYSMEQIEFLLKILKYQIVEEIHSKGKIYIKGIGIFRKKGNNIEYVSESGEISYFTKDGDTQLLN